MSSERITLIYWGKIRYVGPDGVDQTRKSTQLSGGTGANRVLPASVMDAGNVNIKVGTATTVYSPALDPNFLPKR